MQSLRRNPLNGKQLTMLIQQWCSRQSIVFRIMSFCVSPFSVTSEAQQVLHEKFAVEVISSYSFFFLNLIFL